MSDFEKELHAMFDHIWDCEIDHPVFQDTVGELMEAVIQAYEKHKPTLGMNLAEVGTDCISREQAINIAKDLTITVEGYEMHNQAVMNYCADIMQLPPIQPEPHWIPVDLENNKPPLEEWVLVSSDGYVMQDCIAERGGKKIWYHGGNIQSDDRYMPLPEPYKGVTE